MRSNAGFFLCLGLMGLSLWLGRPPVAEAVVFHARDEALQVAFPQADKVEPRDFFLTSEQRGEIEKRARAAVETDLLTVYVGYRGETVIGYAIIDTHVVRTLPETFLVVLSPEGAVRATHVLAFYEPLDYLPSERWMKQFLGKDTPDGLRLGHSIAGITGSTLSARAVTAGVRRALAIHEVLLGGK